MHTLKEIFLTVFRLVFKPNEEWQRIVKQDVDYRVVQVKFYIPLLLLVVLASFVGSILSSDSQSTLDIARNSAHGLSPSVADGSPVEIAMKAVLITLSLFVASYFLSILLLCESLKRWWKINADYGDCLKFVTYSTSILFVVYAIDCIFPSFFVIRVMCFCCAYNFWIGSGYYFPELNNANEKQKKSRTSFMILCILIVSLVSLLLYKIICNLMS